MNLSPRSESVTYLTLSDSRFFPGTVALINSLRLSGNRGEVIVVDRGLSSDERTVLQRVAQVVSLPAEACDTHPFLAKPLAAALAPPGIVIMIDSDMIVTGSLDRAVSAARDGRIFVYPDHAGSWERFFPEWQDFFALQASLRRGQTYVNAGFVAFLSDEQSGFLQRWRHLCSLVPVGRVRDEEWAQPFAAGDQDALNALLMSEISPDAIEIGPPDEEVYWDALRKVEVVDRRRLRCRFRGQPVRILHYSFDPKAWELRAWRRFRKNDAYVRLFRRVVLGNDVEVRLDAPRLPAWLRGGVVAGVVGLALTLFMDLDAALGFLAFTRPIRHRLIRRQSHL